MKPADLLRIAMMLCLFLCACSDPPEEQDDEVEVECRLNSDCPSEQRCVDGECVEDDECVGPECPCTADTDCPNGLLCEQDTGECFVPVCEEDSACGLGEVCERGRCVTDVEADRDLDGVPDNEDLCPDDANADQEDNDLDGFGDVCDTDDDNDGVPDGLDNCAFDFNPFQTDANGDGVGNACDDEVTGASVTGALDFSALQGANTNDARVFISSRDEATLIDEAGRFTYDQVLGETGLFGLRVEWPGFVTLSAVFEADPNEAVHDVGTLLMVPEFVGEEGISLLGSVRLEGSERHEGVLVQAQIGGVPVTSTLSDEAGAYVFETARLEHRLKFSKEGYIGQTLDVIFNVNNDRFEIDGQALADFDGLELAQDRGGSVTGQLLSPLEGVDFARDAVVTLTGPQTRTAVVASNGAFREVGLVRGVYSLDIRVQGHEQVLTVVVVEQGEAQLGVLPLTPIRLPAGGRVLLGGETNHEDTAIRIRRNDALISTSLTDQGGDFILELIPVTYQMSIRHVGFLSQDHTLSFNGEEARFEVDGEALDERVFTLLREPLSDRDTDNIIDVRDNCVDVPNTDQRDIDEDGVGDVCDADVDGDGLPNTFDNCPGSPNAAQEDSLGEGRGIACEGGSADRPFAAGCGVIRQQLDTRERQDDLQATCGGAGAPEVVYSVVIDEDTGLSFAAIADYVTVAYLLDDTGEEVICVNGGLLEVSGPEAEGGQTVPAGHYLLVLDGLVGQGSSGLVEVNLYNTECSEQDVSFRREGEVPGGGQVAQQDLNGDGHLDAVVASDGSVSVLLGLPGGGLGEADTFDGGASPFQVQILDLDGDEFLDILTLSFGTGVFTLHSGDGEGAFEVAQTFEVAENFCSQDLGGRFGLPCSFEVMDFDEDGDVDIITRDASFREQSGLHVLLNNGNGSFESTLAFELFATALETGDLDGDGHLDLVLGSFGQIIVMMNQGEGVYEAGDPILIASRQSAVDMALGDTNGDGHLDLFYVEALQDFFGLLGRGDGTFEEETRFDTQHEENQHVSMGDMNGDGHLDLIGTFIGAPFVVISQGRGDGTFETIREFAMESNGQAPVLADINGNGLLDLIVPNSRAEGLSILLDPMDEDRADQVSLSTPGGSPGFSVADADRDGVLDVLISLPTGGLTRLTEVSPRRFVTQRRFDLPGQADDMVAVDLDLDGKTEIVSVYRANEALRVHKVAGDGAIRLFQETENGSSFRSVASGDLNNDGLPDVVAGHLNPTGTDIFLGVEGGRLIEAGGTPDNAADLILEDITGDGDLDLVAIGAGFILSRPGSGEGDFGDAIATGIEGDPRALALGDFNGDGDLDAVTANTEGGTLALLLSDGAGRFTLETTEEVGESPVDVVAGDFDEDGALDAIVANSIEGDLTIHFGTGTGGFDRSDSVSPEEGLRPTQLTAADLNNDGHLDLAVAYAETDNLLVFYGDGSGELLAVAEQPIGTSPDGIDVGDVDGDGSLDVVVVDSGTLVGSVTLGAQPNLQLGTVLSASDLPPCPALSFEGALGGAFDARWDIGGVEPCRIERLEIALGTGDQAPDSATLRTPLGHLLTLIPTGPDASTWRPEEIASLARLQNHPLYPGRFSMSTPFPFDSATLLINTRPPDPFDPETLAPACDTEADQAPTPVGACRLESDLEGLTLTPGDVDAFLIQGPLRGGVFAGQRIEITLITEPGTPLLGLLLPLQARVPAAQAIETEAGVWELAFVVPDRFDGRAFALIVAEPLSGEGALYDLGVSIR